MALCSGLLHSFKHYMCCCSSAEDEPSPVSKPAPKLQLSQSTKDTVLQLFRQMDLDGSHTISLQETAQWWSSFSKVNTKAMFEAVDVDGNGEISEEEWVEFWTSVLNNGHSDEDITEELGNIKDKISWASLEYKNST